MSAPIKTLQDSDLQARKHKQTTEFIWICRADKKTIKYFENAVSFPREVLQDDFLLLFGFITQFL